MQDVRAPSASYNIFLGRQVGKCAGTAANHNTFLGNYTGYCINGTDNIFSLNRAGFDALAANHNILLGKCSAMISLVVIISSLDKGQDRLLLLDVIIFTGKSCCWWNCNWKL